MNKKTDLKFEKSKAFTKTIEAIVPGGAHTYSKGRDQFPENAPNGIVRGRGAIVWDADGNEFVDWSMGLTSVSLGHADPLVNGAVTDAIADGINFQRPSQIELKAAEMWTQLTGHEMVKFARHGSSATTAAVKLARAHTGRSIVAAPEEHGFFSFDDWFIGSTPCDRGIPDEIKRFTVKFHYNDLSSLDQLFQTHPDEIACIIMEPVKFDPPTEGFLEGVRGLCRKNGAVLIFDEMISGFKMGMPGAQNYFGVQPDLTTWGKGIGNGFSISAITGSAEIMRLGGLEPEGMRKLFLLSSTHGGETVGCAALIATAEQFMQNDIVGDNWRKGALLREALSRVIERHGLAQNMEIAGYPCLLTIDLKNNQGQSDASLMTLMMQEMISRGVLWQFIFAMTPSHGEVEQELTLSAFDGACAVIKEALSQGSVDALLVGPPIKPVFRSRA